LFITGLGWFNAFINGQRVDPSRFLDPSVSHFEERIFYVTFDVSHLLKPNTTNLIGIELGHGWWNQVCCNPGPLTIARLSMTDKTGAKSYVLTDETWEGFNGGTTQNSLYDGQIFDGRSDVSHWAVPGKLPYIMATPIITSPPTRNIRAMRIPPIRSARRAS
jgi:alpha-L-rhamnosidase